MRGYSAIGLWNAKDPINVGSALRAAHAFGVCLFVVSGVRYRRAATDTPAASRHLPLVHADDPLDVLPLDCIPVAVEVVDGARDLPAYTHPERAFYVFGPEDGSLPKRVLDRCRDVVRIPSGCLNLAATVNVVLYDRMAKRKEAA
jgi:tRNA(Leu) C34 or U34 (ribose-2'-O)-methylase TrmL